LPSNTIGLLTFAIGSPVPGLFLGWAIDDSGNNATSRKIIKKKVLLLRMKKATNLINQINAFLTVGVNGLFYRGVVASLLRTC
jgi:hypothetical protein